MFVGNLDVCRAQDTSTSEYSSKILFSSLALQANPGSPLALMICPFARPVRNKTSAAQGQA
jgi:hypothetical protein